MIGRNCASTSLRRRLSQLLGVIALLGFAVRGATGQDQLILSDPIPPDQPPYNSPEVIYYSTGGLYTPTPSAATHNQQAVSAGMMRWLDYCGAGGERSPSTDATHQMLLQVPGASPLDQQAALDLLGGEIYGTAQSIGLRIGDRSLRAIGNRIINNDVFLNDDELVLVGQANRTVPLDGSSPIIRGQAAVPIPGTWLQGYGSSGSWDADGNASGATFGLGGLAYGIDIGRDGDEVLGITGGNTYTTFSNNLTDRGDVTSWQIGLYAVKKFERMYTFGIVNYGHNQFHIDRTINTGNGQSIATSDFTGNQFGSYGELGWNVQGRIWRLQPLLGLQYMSVSNGWAMEAGTPAALNVSSSNLRTLQSHLGARLISRRMIDNYGRRWTPYLNARWVYDMLGHQATSTASLSGAPGASWAITGNQTSRSMLMFGPGLNLEITSGVSAFVNYEVQWGTDYQAYTGSGGIMINF